MVAARLDVLTDDAYRWVRLAAGASARATRCPAWPPAPVTRSSTSSCPSPVPPPITTIAWRMGHLSIGVFGTRGGTTSAGLRKTLYEYVVAADGGRRPGAARPPPRRVARRGAGARRRLGWARPCGPAERNYADAPLAPSWCCTSTGRRCTTAPSSGADARPVLRPTTTEMRLTMDTPQLQIAIDAHDPHLLNPLLVPGVGLRHGGPPRPDRADVRGRATPPTTTVIEFDGRKAWKEAAAEHRDPAGRWPRLLFQHVPEAKTVKNRVHLDLHVAPRASGRPRSSAALVLGATKLYDGQLGPQTWVHPRRPRGQRVLRRLTQPAAQVLFVRFAVGCPARNLTMTGAVTSGGVTSTPRAPPRGRLTTRPVGRGIAVEVGRRSLAAPSGR